MRFRVLTEELNKGLGMVLRAKSVRPLREVYEGVLLEAADACLRLTCSDGEITIVTDVPAMIEEEGSCLLPGQLFGDLMRKQNAGEAEFSMDGNNRVTIRTSGSKTSPAT